MLSVAPCAVFCALAAAGGFGSNKFGFPAARIECFAGVGLVAPDLSRKIVRERVVIRSNYCGHDRERNIIAHNIGERVLFGSAGRRSRE